MTDFPKPDDEDRIDALGVRMLKAFARARIHPSLDLGHACMAFAATLFEDRSREQFLELAGWWWDQTGKVDRPVTPAVRAPLPDSEPDLALEAATRASYIGGREAERQDVLQRLRDVAGHCHAAGAAWVNTVKVLLGEAEKIERAEHVRRGGVDGDY